MAGLAWIDTGGIVCRLLLIALILVVGVIVVAVCGDILCSACVHLCCNSADRSKPQGLLARVLSCIHSFSASVPSSLTLAGAPLRFATGTSWAVPTLLKVSTLRI